jgi:hypothetical protein
VLAQVLLQDLEGPLGARIGFLEALLGRLGADAVEAAAERDDGAAGEDAVLDPGVGEGQPVGDGGLLEGVFGPVRAAFLGG